MPAGNDILFFLSVLGWFNALILGVYFLFIQKPHSIQKFLFSALVIVMSLRVAKSVLWWFYPDLPILIIQIGLLSCLFIGPVLYYFLKSSLQQYAVFPKFWLANLVCHFVIGIIVLVVFFNKRHIPIWRTYIIPGIYLQWFFYIVLCTRIVKPLVLVLFQRDKGLSLNQRWYMAVYLSNVIVFISYVSSFSGFNIPYITGPLIFTGIVYVNLVIFLHRKRIDSLFFIETDKVQRKKMSIDFAQSCLNALEEIMRTEQLYINPELRLSDLAARLQISSHQLSQLLNDHLGKNFNAYINDYRVQKACELIVVNNEMKLEVVGYEVGFNSKSSFFTAFRKFTGTTPKLYKQQLS